MYTMSSLFCNLILTSVMSDSYRQTLLENLENPFPSSCIHRKARVKKASQIFNVTSCQMLEIIDQKTAFWHWEHQYHSCFNKEKKRHQESNHLMLEQMKHGGDSLASSALGGEGRKLT